MTVKICVQLKFPNNSNVFKDNYKMKNIFTIMVLITGIALVFAFTACERNTEQSASANAARIDELTVALEALQAELASANAVDGGTTEIADEIATIQAELQSGTQGEVSAASTTQGAGASVVSAAEASTSTTPAATPPTSSQTTSTTAASSVRFPAGITVIESEAHYFSGLTGSLVIPNTVTVIGERAFADNRLTSVTIPASVTTIGQRAFLTNQLTSVVIPNSVTTIGAGAFAHNRLTGSLIIPDSVTSLGNDAFAGDEMAMNSRLTSVTIGSGVTAIGRGTFQCNRITSVTIPNSVTSIGDVAFYRNLLTSVTIPSSVTVIGNSAFRDNQLTSIVISSGVTSIGEAAFMYNQLTSVTIPASVTSIGASAFAGNPNLTRIEIEGARLLRIPENTFGSDFSSVYNGSGIYERIDGSWSKTGFFVYESDDGK